MERTISITPLQCKKTGVKELKKYDSVYLGSEFCENKLPSADDVISLAETYKGRIVPVIPYLSDTGAERARQLFDSLPAGLVSEAVVNDWSMLDFLRKKHRKISPILGRLLMWEISSMNKPFLKAFCARYGIKSVEVDNPLVLANLKGYEGKINFNYPLQFKSTTRFCPYMKRFNSERCGQPCEKTGLIKLKNKKVFPLELLMFSNAYFIVNKPLKDPRITRLVETKIA